MYKRTLSAIVLAALMFGCALAATRADDPPPITKKQLKTAVNNLKQIALAFHNYHDANGFLPIDKVGKDGKALLSWRVEILPYVEELTLYNQFKMDEAWDSENNKKLIEKMPKLYSPIRVKAKEGETFYQVFTGEDALFGPKKKPTMVGITDGTSNTGMVFEAGEPVIWTKPADLPFDKKKPLPKLGGLFDGECHVAFCDGHVSLLKKDRDEEQLKFLIMPSDGMIIDLKKLEK
jgi:prepilin-type processing-associated H-X9-DG protein